jgi:hypothetical protein
VSFAWLSEKQPGAPLPWRWARRRRTVPVDVAEVLTRAEQAMAIAERLRTVEDPGGVVVAEIGALHTLARDLLRWAR